MAKEKINLAVDSPVRLVLEAIRKKAGSKSAATLLIDGTDSDVEEVIPSGIDVLDHHVLAIGGWPLGRIVELFAAEGAGKSSVLHQTIAGVQRENGIATLAETEHAIDAKRATVFGADIGTVIISQPECMEDTLAMIEYTLDAFPKTKKGDPPNFIGWDSLAATPTRAEVENGVDAKAAVADRARLMSMSMRVLTKLVAEKRALLMVVNQTREKFGGGGFGGPSTTTPGGSALKFHASFRLELFSGKSVKDGDDHIGKQVTMMAAKTKIGGAPWAKAKIRLYYKSGWNNVWSTINHAKTYKLVPKDRKATEENYLEALKALGWIRGFAAGAPEAKGVVEEDNEVDADLELLGPDDGDDL